MKISNKDYLQRRIANVLVESREKARKDKLDETVKQVQLSKARAVLLRQLVQESMEILDEVDAPPGDPMGAPAPAPGGAPPGPPPPTGQPMDMAPPMDSPPGVDPNAPPDAEITLEKVIAKLNTIRGGKSLRDPMIYNKLNTYYESLEEGKKGQLFDFLSNIAQVITDIVDGTQPPAPPAGMPPDDMGMPPMDAAPPAPPAALPAPPAPPAQPPTPIQPTR
jgi:hypothetical protein